MVRVEREKTSFFLQLEEGEGVKGGTITFWGEEGSFLTGKNAFSTSSSSASSSLTLSVIYICIIKSPGVGWVEG